MTKSWDEVRLTITADDLMGKTTPAPSPAAPPPGASTSAPLAWMRGKLARSSGWPWREITLTLAACLVGAVVVALVVNSGLSLPSLPRRRTVPALTAPATPLPAIEPTARVLEVAAPPVVVIVTSTPAAPVQAAPRQVSPVAPLRQAAPPTRPQAQPTAAPITRGVTVQPTAPAPTTGPQERLLTRDCVYPSHPQGTVIQGYYTDANGVKRDAICKPDGWKAVE